MAPPDGFAPGQQADRVRSAPRDELLTIIEVCEELGISRATFYRWRAYRRGPASLRLPNGSIRIRRSALTAFLASCEEAFHNGQRGLTGADLAELYATRKTPKTAGRR